MNDARDATAASTALILLAALLAATPGHGQPPYLVRDINVRPGWSEPMGIVNLGSVAIFSAVRPDVGRELWVTDGTAAGTRLLADICPGPCSGFREGFDLAGMPPGLYATRAGSLAFFAANDGIGEALWASDGTMGGTRRVANAVPFPLGPGVPPGPLDAVAVGSTLYFISWGSELWRTDGTPGATQRTSVLRNDDLVAIDPPSPPLGSFLPLDPLRDAYRTIGPGSIDPDLGVLADVNRPLVFYGFDGSGTIRLVKTEAGLVRLES